MSERILIVNADDLGLSVAVNMGIARGHEHGVVTSASLLVRGAAAEDAGEYARSHPELSVGLHVDLGEWSYRDGAWVAEYEVVDLDDHRAVELEVARQLDRFHELTGDAPTHLDSHQHLHRNDPARSVIVRAASSVDAPVRGCHLSIAHRGDFYGQDGRGRPYPECISLAAFERIVASLSPGWTELGCHPGELDGSSEGMYQEERAVELGVLCDERARQVLDRHRVGLSSFRAFART